MTTPINIVIGPYSYRIEPTKNLCNSEHEPLYGEIEHGDLVIRIDEKYLDHQRTKAILWHEILHGLIEQAGIDHSDEAERIVVVLGVGVADVLAKNPEMAG